jgi:HK97 family phage portal protein
MPDGSAQRVYSTMLLGSPIAGGGPQLRGTFYNWMFAGTTAALLHGNGWGMVTNRSGIPGADGLGLPTGVAWLPSERVDVQDDEMQPENPNRARIYYMGRLIENHSDLVHLPAFVIPGRLEAVSPLKAFSMLWGQGHDALNYSASWFQNGGFPPGTFQNISEEVDDQQARVIRRRLGDAIRLREPLVYGKDWDYKALAVPQNEAAFIQAMQLNATQVAAIYGVQAWRVGGTRNDGMTYSNVTMNQLDELQTTLRPWITRWEHLLTSLLPATQYVKFDVDDLLRMDPKNRTEVYQIQRNIGTRTTNEIRAEDDLPAILGGNDPIALPVLERMMATTRTIPKSMMPLVIPEADRIAALLEHMAELGLTNPVAEQSAPINKSAESYLGGLITQVRALPPGNTPVTDQHRQNAVSMLKAHQAAGNLAPQETQLRISKAEKAKTVDELQELFNDLPGIEDMKPKGKAPDAARMRASDADREQARRLLAQHARDGRLRGHELDERSRQAGEAITCGDLDTLFADLPDVELAAAHPEDEDRTGHPLFGPAAMALLLGKAQEFETAATAAMNGKAH